MSDLYAIMNIVSLITNLETGFLIYLSTLFAIRVLMGAYLWYGKCYQDFEI